MLNLKTLTLKNFMSVGAVTQTVNLNSNDLVLILGENLDLGGNDSKNGVGKTSICNALSYALFGKPLVNIKMDNLINKTNSKAMYVTLDYEFDGVEYRIERGRKPAVFKLIKNGSSVNQVDEAQGENSQTQQTIENTINMSYDLFRHIVALNTYVEPFLSQRPSEQQHLIEQLQGITKLSEKAELLKEEIKTIKDEIKSEEFRIKAAEESNTRIKKNIQHLETKSSEWEIGKVHRIKDIQLAIADLSGLSIDDEIRNHQKLTEFIQAQSDIDSLDRSIASEQKKLLPLRHQVTRLTASLQSISNSTCPTCNQTINDCSHEQLSSTVADELEQVSNLISESEANIHQLTERKSTILLPDKPNTYYPSLSEAYRHKTTIDTLLNELDRETNSLNPYLDQIEMLKSTGIQEVDFSGINALSVTRDHQAFLLKLLTNKDSFIRKKIIDQSLSFLNSRLTNYLTAIGLPHQVKFQPDLSVDINLFGKDFDFDNLSRGERTRLTLALSWAFRDVYESTNGQINIMFIDEITDQGLDASGAESVLKILKDMSRHSKKDIFLISHREEYVSRIDRVLKVIKENGFTSLEMSD